MTYYKCKFAGKPRNEGRFGAVKKGDELLLTKEEYDCVAEDNDFEFIEEVQENLPERILGNPTSPYTDGSRSPSNLSDPSEPSRVGQDLDGDGIPDDEEGEEDEPSMTYEDMKKDELIEEIEERNEGRDEEDQISTSGKKDELIARLEEDDDDESSE